jgi:hypothetical protein
MPLVYHATMWKMSGVLVFFKKADKLAKKLRKKQKNCYLCPYFKIKMPILPYL